MCAACKVIHFIGDKICHNTAKARVAFLSQRNNELKQQTPSLKSANFLKSSCRDFKKQALLSRRLVRTGLTAVPRVLEDLLLETISWTNFASAFGGALNSNFEPPFRLSISAWQPVEANLCLDAQPAMQDYRGKMVQTLWLRQVETTLKSSLRFSASFNCIYNIQRYCCARGWISFTLWSERRLVLGWVAVDLEAGADYWKNLDFVRRYYMGSCFQQTLSRTVFESVRCNCSANAYYPK